MSYLFFVLHFRSRMLLSSAKQKKQILSDKRASYLPLSVIMGLQYILLLIEILINAGFIKKRGRSVNIIYGRSRMQPQLRSKATTRRWQNVTSNFCSASQRIRPGNADMPDLCIDNSLMLQLGPPLSASLHSLCRWAWQSWPALYFTLIYDLCRGGCIREISLVHLCHATATGHEKTTQPLISMHVRVCMCNQLKRKCIQFPQLLQHSNLSLLTSVCNHSF